MIDELEYSLFCKKMNKIFEVDGPKEMRIVIGEAPFPDSENLDGKCIGSDYPFKKIAFFRDKPAKGTTKRTVSRIWYLLFGKKSEQVRKILPNSEEKYSEEKYLVKYLEEYHYFYFINVFSDKEKTEISHDFCTVCKMQEEMKLLIVGEKAANKLQTKDKPNSYFIIHPAARGKHIATTKCQWEDMNFVGNKKYSSSAEIISEFRLKLKNK